MHESLKIISVALPLIALFILSGFFIRRIRQAKRIITDRNGMKKISANPSIFGGNAGKTWFYDDQFLYGVKNNATRKIALANIIKIGPGNTEINSRRVWIVIYRDGANEKQVQFYNNLTLWNHNFTAFLAAVKRANPDAVVKERSLLNL
ncbi:hypothetical protein AI2839V1_2037 [Enterobacter cloacae]|uniref:Uncharacterized protein n=1 Tax=Enterobacter sichuanensis TaxID=2071710 RepID=A0AAE4DWQ1_9ENTR|nr:MULTISPECIES: hypothetical protein [Enterobacter]CAF2445375.1 hypothetical protein AI2839V1_2037 [Enterobacter cloacae]KLW91751.1 hypothetical protein SP99_01971 [Enterobacter sp. BIDMC92]MCI8904098.1 hypothetical protein [Enterobacter sp.]MDR0172593.1 hypothetical protein [Enterobacter sichuanensis]MDR9947036.1 hypothetical protein [Enterobacter sichuanensis]